MGSDTGTELLIWSNIIGWSDGESGLYSAEGIGVDAAWNLAYATYSGRDYAGELQEDESNLVANPLFVDFTDDGLIGNDDLALSEDSPAIDSGPDRPGWADTDGSQNDRGATGGPGAE